MHRITKSHHAKYDDMCEDVVKVLQGICEAIGVPSHVTPRDDEPPKRKAGPGRPPEWAVDDGIFDEVAVARAVDRGGVKLTRREAVDAVRRMARRGLTDREAGERLGVCGKTVERLRIAEGIPSGYRSDDIADLKRRNGGAWSA